MKKLLLVLAIVLSATAAYAQRDVPAGGEMELASIESGDEQITLYKVKDAEGNPAFILAASITTSSLDIQTPGSSFSIGTGDGVALHLGERYEDALESLEDLIDLFSEADGTQIELPCADGGTVVAVLHKGFLGKHLSVGRTSLSKGDLKAIRSGLKISKKLHSDL